MSMGLVWPACAQQEHAAGNPVLTQQEKDFLMAAYISNMMEIEAGKAAQNKSNNKQVQQYGAVKWN